MSKHISLIPAVSSEDIKKASADGILIFGCGSFAKDLSQAAKNSNINVIAFVATAPTESQINGLPVHSLKLLPQNLKSYALWIGVYNREAHSDLATISTNCHEHGLSNVYLPQNYYPIIQEELGWRLWLASPEHYASSEHRIHEALNLLDDQQSRSLFLATINFRLGSLADSPQPDTEPQYFPSFILETLGDRPFMVDGGAYNGDTLFIASTYIKPRGAIAFEPDLENFAALSQNTRNLPFPVTNIPCGLSDKTASEKFTSGFGEGCAISQNGEKLIQTVTLDELLSNTDVDYLKLDIEGQELSALFGAKNTLIHKRPTLAIAGYHRWDDLWNIPNFLHELGLGYKLTYRMHGSNTFDGVFYAT